MLRPGPGKVLVRPGERTKILESGLALPKSAQDDAFHGEVLAVGEGAWLVEGSGGLEWAMNDDRRAHVRRHMPVSVGDIVYFEPERMHPLAEGFSADSDSHYILDVRDILGTGEVAR